MTRSAAAGRAALRVGAACAALLAVALPAGCGGDDGAAASSGSAADRPELVVFGASSLGPAFEAYAKEIDYADVRYSFAGSDDLAAQIRQGVTPDVYAAANLSLPGELFRDGLVEKPRQLVTNRLVVGVPQGSEIDSVEDLEEPGLQIAIGDEDVPVGRYTREVLGALGPGASKAILANVASEEPDVGGIVGKLTQGAVDAGFVYRSDVASSSGRLEEVDIPKAASPDVAYAIAVGAGAPQPMLAQRYVEGLLEPEGQKVLTGAGFGLPRR